MNARFFLYPPFFTKLLEIVESHVRDNQMTKLYKRSTADFKRLVACEP